MPRLFEGVREFTPAARGRAQGLVQAVSTAGETLDFAQPVELSGNLRLTVEALDAELTAALKKVVHEACEQFEQLFATPLKSAEKYERLMRALPQQALVLAAQVGWTANCLSCFAHAGKEDKSKAHKKTRVTPKDAWANLKSPTANISPPWGRLPAAGTISFSG